MAWPAAKVGLIHRHHTDFTLSFTAPAPFFMRPGLLHGLGCDIMEFNHIITYIRSIYIMVVKRRELGRFTSFEILQPTSILVCIPAQPQLCAICLNNFTYGASKTSVVRFRLLDELQRPRLVLCPAAEEAHAVYAVKYRTTSRLGHAR
jgi:hypothetical protein